MEGLYWVGWIRLIEVDIRTIVLEEKVVNGCIGKVWIHVST